MYIPEFWVGVVSTILAEVAIFIAVANLDKRKKGGAEDEQ